MHPTQFIWPAIGSIAGLVILLWFVRSWHNIGPTQQGLVQRNFGNKKLGAGEIIALKGECGYCADTLSPGWNFVPAIIYSVSKHPIPNIDPGELGLVVAQTGAPLPQGARTAAYNDQFGDFEELRKFLQNGGQKGRQRRVLRPGTYKIHPVGFLVITASKVYGVPMDPELRRQARQGELTYQSFDIKSEELLKPTVIKAKSIAEAEAESRQRDLEEQKRLAQEREAQIQDLEQEMNERERMVSELLRSVNEDQRRKDADPEGKKPAVPLKLEKRHQRTRVRRPQPERSEHLTSTMGIVTAHEGPALEDGQLACRIQGWADIEKEADDKKRIQLLLAAQNTTHKAYQDFEEFLKAGGRAGLQHDGITEGTYYLNPWLVSVEPARVIHVMEGEVAVIKSKVGLVDDDISGAEFKFGTIVRPGHRGL